MRAFKRRLLAVAAILVLVPLMYLCLQEVHCRYLRPQRNHISTLLAYSCAHAQYCSNIGLPPSTRVSELLTAYPDIGCNFPHYLPQSLQRRLLIVDGVHQPGRGEVLIAVNKQGREAEWHIVLVDNRGKCLVVTRDGTTKSITYAEAMNLCNQRNIVLFAYMEREVSNR
jgi:hypothetical protein